MFSFSLWPLAPFPAWRSLNPRLLMLPFFYGRRWRDSDEYRCHHLHRGQHQQYHPDRPPLPFCLTRDGYGPKIFGRIHPTYRTPAVAIVVQTYLALIIAMSGSFLPLAMLYFDSRLSSL